MLTPLDIENRKFKKSIIGYSQEDVDEFLDRIIESYEAIYKENIELKDKIGVLTEGIQQYKSLEDTLKNTLLAAQSTSEDIKKNAYEKADVILKEAEVKAERIAADTSQEVVKIKFELEELKRKRNVFRAKIESQLLAQLELIKDSPFEE
jgi:cell division initiation protein